MLLEYMPIMDESAKFIIETTTNERILLSCMYASSSSSSNIAVAVASFNSGQGTYNEKECEWNLRVVPST